jgi:hypothetical protein
MELPMPRLPVISYTTSLGADGNPKRQSGVYYLATTTDLVQFYCFDEPHEKGSEGKFTMIDQFDRGQLLGAGDKETAKVWAKRLGLKLWTYVRI